MVIAHRGSRVSAMLLGIVGAVLQITAITQVVADVSDPAGIIVYAVGGCASFTALAGQSAGTAFNCRKRTVRPMSASWTAYEPLLCQVLAEWGVHQA